ncbi:hypothetical protein [Paenibacillus maysiensis]|uniref:hypothetical protein n=1 Tax=Paenibacillus maysiensis TaxID=1155954 RepID=UPI0004707848|nr:hypothetical protein [Paenibacillus maysiensis]
MIELSRYNEATYDYAVTEDSISKKLSNQMYDFLETENTSLWIPSQEDETSQLSIQLVRSLGSMAEAGSRYIVVVDIDSVVLEDQLKAMDLGHGELQLLTLKGEFLIGKSEEDGSNSIDVGAILGKETGASRAKI